MLKMLDKKAITYKRLIEAIYYELVHEESERNVLEDEEFKATYQNFHEKYIDPKYKKSFDEGVEMYEALNELIYSRAKKAFEIGFESAITLFVKGAKEDVL